MFLRWNISRLRKTDDKAEINGSFYMLQLYKDSFLPSLPLTIYPIHPSIFLIYLSISSSSRLLTLSSCLFLFTFNKNEKAKTRNRHKESHERTNARFLIIWSSIRFFGIILHLPCLCIHGSGLPSFVMFFVIIDIHMIWCWEYSWFLYHLFFFSFFSSF